METRELVGKIAFWCGAKNASRISELFLHVYDLELGGGTVFDRNNDDIDNFENRSCYLWDMLYADESVDSRKVAHCERLMAIIERSHYLDEHGEKGQAKIIDDIVAEAKGFEAMFPDIAKEVSVNDALVMGWST